MAINVNPKRIKERNPKYPKLMISGDTIIVATGESADGGYLHGLVVQDVCYSPWTKRKDWILECFKDHNKDVVLRNDQ